MFTPIFCKNFKIFTCLVLRSLLIFVVILLKRVILFPLLAIFINFETLVAALPKIEPPLKGKLARPIANDVHWKALVFSKEIPLFKPEVFWVISSIAKNR
jgi:hypothetical protein